MKTLFATSLISAFVSLVAVVGSSVITIVPGPRSEIERRTMMLSAGAFFFIWLWLALWARARHRAASRPPPKLLIRLLVGVSVVYSFFIILVVIG